MTALLLVNLGTPQSADPRDVGRYLKEFLIDPFVIDIPFLARWFLVNVLVLPRRSKASATLYSKIWTPQGSPLLVFTRDLEQKVKRLWDGPVGMAMRYGEPSIRQGLEALRTSNPDRLVVFPLYPQYSLAATQSSIEKVRSELKSMGWNIEPTFIPPFYRRSEYLDAVVEVSRPHLEGFKWDRVLFSYHGLPERHVRKTDPSRGHCLTKNACCEKPVVENSACYRHQCFETTRELAKRLGLHGDQYFVGFQSRLGGTPWVQPYSDEWYEKAPKLGVKRLLVLTPSFVADCLETLEEVAIRGSEQFRHAGGLELKLVPSLNAEDVWARAVVQIASQSSQ